eukprot:156218-Amorphochlora_amoeboformis.AAC.1
MPQIAGNRGDCWRSQRFLEIPEISGSPGDFWKSRRFLEIPEISGNPEDFWKSGDFYKSGRFLEIPEISGNRLIRYCPVPASDTTRYYPVLPGVFQAIRWQR